MKIGVTSQNFKTITPHAGRTRRFLVYEATDLENILEVERFDLPKEMAMHEWHDNNDPHPLDTLDTLIVNSCGDGFIRRMEKRGVKVIKASQDDPLVAIKLALRNEKDERTL